MNQRRLQGDSQNPFDQRFLFFMLAAMSILLLFNSFFAPPPVVEPGEAGLPVVDPAEAVAEPLTPVVPLAEVAPIEPDEAAETGEAAPPSEPARIALGSVAAEGAYRMLMTIDNVGAGVERIELSSDNYRDLDDRSGYLGHLGLIPNAEGGARVTVVGEGTPAQESGLLAGDILVSVQHRPRKARKTEPKPIDSDAAFEAMLAETLPRDELELTVRRDGRTLQHSVTLSRQPLDLIRPEAENLALHQTPPPVGFTKQPSFLFRLTSVDGQNGAAERVATANESLRHEAWSIDASQENEVTLRKPLPDLALEVVKRFRVVEVPEAERANRAYPGYHFDLSVEVLNLATSERRVAYELTGPNGLPIEGYWYVNKIGRGWSGYGIRDVVVRFANDRFTQLGCREVVAGDIDPMGQGRPLAYAGVDAQYFASIVIPQKDALTEVRYGALRAELATPALGDKALDTWENASCVFERSPAKLAPAGTAGDHLTDGYQVFAGPKLPALLGAYQAGGDSEHALDDLLYYGWFGPVARVMLGILHTFNALVGNYGIAIILLTALVRGCLFPISRSQAKNMIKMQELKPEMDRLAAKHKDDMQKRSVAQQELFRKHNYNPAAGCLPMFLQLPIFLGLYRALAVDVELRQAPLFSHSIRFCSNLASPDMFYDWSQFTPQWMDTGQGMLGLGPYFNLLPLLTVVLFLLQQKMFMPEATNDQMRMQQQMMKYMMGFMGLLFFKVPSGLCLYFIASSLWGIAERKLLPKPAPVEPQAENLSKTRTVPNKKSNGTQRKPKGKNTGKKKRR